MSFQKDDFSALKLYSPRQVLLIIMIIICVFLIVLVFGAEGLCALLTLFHGCSISMVCFRLWLINTGINLSDTGMVAGYELLSDFSLPSYTVLLPLYRESKVLPGLIKTISAQDYPKNKLQVLLLVEEDDAETLNALALVELPEYFEVVMIPDSQPKTKPKACNIGLKNATGAIICIFDADDQPESLQLRKVASFLWQQPLRCVCVQGRLNFFNANETWLSKMFEIEYRLLFDYMLPAAAHHRWPIPLGGSSNHFRADFLHAFEWDSYNVTEDAELGMRLAAFGFYATTLDVETPEEAPYTLKPWLKQRSRWIKGYFITALIYGRHYFNIMAKLPEGSGFFFNYIMVLGPLLMLVTPWALFASMMLWLDIMKIDAEMHRWFFSLSLVSFSIFFWSFASTAWRVIKVSDRIAGCSLALTFPFYFILHSIAAVMALYKVFTYPYYWEKTEHGVSRIKNIFSKKKY